MGDSHCYFHVRISDLTGSYFLSGVSMDWPISGHTPLEYIQPVRQGHITTDIPARWKLVKEEIVELDSGYINTYRQFEPVEILGDGTGDLGYEIVRD